MWIHYYWIVANWFFPANPDAYHSVEKNDRLEDPSAIQSQLIVFCRQPRLSDWKLTLNKTEEIFQMENQAKVRQANAIAHAVRVIGILFFIAMAFQVMTWKYAIFGGVACFIIAPALRRIIIGQYETES